MDNKEFKVDIKNMFRNRQNGVSGLMRVKNDAEFVVDSIASCIDALDELIIVYNDCTDNTPILIRQMQDRYPNKIKIFEYIPTILSTNLTREEYVMAKELPDDSEHLLSNYYNYALSKSNYRYILKIDADQIYFTEKLKKLCDAYRSNRICKIKFSEWMSFLIVIVYFIKSKIKIIRNINFDIENHYILYLECIYKLVNNFKIPVSLSGVNVVYSKKWFVSIGKCGLSLNILSPFNGIGDHLLFEINRKTKFIPYDCIKYNVLSTSKYSYIERLVGVGKAWPIGFFWFHLNGMRRNIYKEQLRNLELCSNAFMPIDEFIHTKFDEIDNLIPKELLAPRIRKTFRFLHNGEILKLPVEKLKSFVYF